MKKISLILGLFVSVLTFAQEGITEKINDFTELKVYDLISVTLIHSDENKVIIKGDDAESVKIVNEDGVLKIRMIIENSFDGNNTSVQVYYKNISILDANEGSEIRSSETINAPSLEVRVQEGSKINVAVSADNLNVKAVSGGIINLSGKANIQNININSGGTYEGKELKTEITEVAVTAGGMADVFASLKCDARVTAGGKIKIYGNPKEVMKKKLAGGKISIMK